MHLNKSIIHHFAVNRDGNFAIISSIVLVLLLIAASVVVDFSAADRSKTRLQDAADAAVLSAATAIYHRKASNEKANQEAKRTLRATDLDQSKYNCEKVTYVGDVVRIECRGHVSTTFAALVGQKRLNFNVSASASVGRKPKVEVTLVYDISDSMLTDGKLTALERGLNTFLSADVFRDAEYETVFSFIPYANSVAFAPNFEKWVDPVSGYSISPTFNRCFTPSATDPNIPFTGSDDYEAAPERLSNKSHTYCPVAGLEARFFMTNRNQAADMISGITTSNGTGSNEALMWGYRSLVPSMQGVLSDNISFPRSFDDEHRKILIFLTDGKPKNKPWVGRAIDDPNNAKTSERNFEEVCRYIRKSNADMDVYMIGFGKIQRSGKDLAPLLKNCTLGDGVLILADNQSIDDELLKIVNINTDIALVE